MQSMPMLTHVEQVRQAICDREGQVLFVHAAPLRLSVGDYVVDRLSAAERNFLRSQPDDRDLLLLCRRQAVLLRRRLFCGFLMQTLPLEAPPEAFGAVLPLAEQLGLTFSPGMLSVLDPAHPMAEAAAAELMQICGTVGGGLPTRMSAEGLFASLAALPPLCTRPLMLSGALSIPFGGDWPIIAYCLAAFLCRGGFGEGLKVTAGGSPALPMLTLTAASPLPLPSGRSGLEMLSRHFPDAPELVLVCRLAARNRIGVTAFSDRQGQLCLCAETFADPASFGLKQTPGLNVEAEAAEEAEWCRLLRAVGLREK